MTTDPRTVRLTWHPDDLHKAIERAHNATRRIEPDQPVQLPWIDVACLLDMARAWMNAQETVQPTELREVPHISPAEFEAFKTRWISQHGQWQTRTWPADQPERGGITALQALKAAGISVEDISAGWETLRYGTWKTCDDPTCTDCADYLADQHAGPEIGDTSDDADGRSP